MKSNFIKKFILMTSAVAVGFGMLSSVVFASGAVINSSSGDLKTVRVSNYSAQPESMSWGPTVNSAAGQIVAVGIYYHNSGDQTLQNLRIKLSPQNSGSASTHSFTATLSAENATTVTDTASVQVIDNAQSLTYIPTAVYWYPNQACKNNPSCRPTTLPLGQNGGELFGSGLVIGNIAPGWATQGGLTVQFKVSSNGGTNQDNPEVTTFAATGVSDSSGSATLRGSVDPNGTSVSAWFKYRRNGGAWIETAHQSLGTTAQNISKSLTGLADGEYEFRAVANSTYEGVSKYFTIGDVDPTCDPCDPCGDDYPCTGNGEPEVDTLSPTNIDEDSATLRGDLTDDGDLINDVYFKWGTSSNNLNRTLDAGTKSNPGSFSKNLSGLNDDTTYYYKACADNNEGTDCGSIESFDTDGDVDPCDYNECCGTRCTTEDRPDITTLNAVAITTSSAVIDGYYNANGCSVTTYFEYGRTTNLGSVTSSTNRGNGSGSMAYAFTSLSPNTTYYFRAVGTNCEGATRGVIKSFTTRTGTIIITDRPDGPVVIGTGGGSQFIKLMIDNHRSTVRSGTDIVYDLAWENITRSTIKGLILEVNFDDMVAIDTDMGDISRDGHSVIVELDTLGSRESGEMSITTRTSSNLKEGDPVVAQAILAFENPKTSASENAIAYDSDEFSTRGSTLGASIFGLGLPTSLGGWLIILLIILLIIVLARHFMRQNRTSVVVNSAAHPTSAAASPATGDDYIVYRPTQNK